MSSRPRVHSISRAPTVTPVDGSDLIFHVHEWLLDCSSGDLDELTAVNYRNQIRPFTIWWEEYAPQHDWLLTPAALKDFKRWLRHDYRTPRNTMLAANSRRTYISHVREFLGWLYREHRLAVDITAWVKVPSTKPSDRRPHTLDDLAKLLDAASSSRNPERDCALIAFLAGTGARRHEAWSALIDHLQIHADGSGSCFLHETKMDKPRTVLFGPSTGRLLIQHLDTEQRHTGPLFGLRTDDAIRQAIQRLGKRCGIENASPQRLRKLFSSYWYACYPDDKRAAFILRLLMGHAPIDVTENHYLMLSEKETRPWYVSPMEAAGTKCIT